MFSEANPCGRAARAFTLIELLVVISIIALLIGILLPVMAQARRAANQATCLANVQQLAVGVYTWAADNDGHIPSGSDLEFPLSPGTTWGENMSNWIWVIQDPGFGVPESMHNAHGVLLDGYLGDNRAMVCPGTDSPQYYQGELDNYRASSADIHSSYLYRQLDQTDSPYIENLGDNAAGEPARALFTDTNRLGPAGVEPATNHGTTSASVGYVDGHAKTVDNSAGHLNARIEDYEAMPTSLLNRISDILLAMDYSERNELDTFSP